MPKGKFEIPDAMRDMAERNIEQAHSAYAKFSEMATKAQDMASTSSDSVSSSARDIQGKALEFAQENMETGFSLAADLAKAGDMKEFFEIQTRYAQSQMKSYTDQAQELGRLMGQAAQSTKPKS